MKVLDFEAPKSTKRLIVSFFFEILGSTFLEKRWQTCSPPKFPRFYDWWLDLWSSKRHDQCLKGWKLLRRGLPRRVGRQRFCRFEIWTLNVQQMYHFDWCGTADSVEKNETISDIEPARKCLLVFIELSMVPWQSSLQAVTLPTPVNGGRVIDTPCIWECGTGFKWV